MTPYPESDLDRYTCPVCGEELLLHWKRCPGCDTRILDSGPSGAGRHILLFIVLGIVIVGLLFAVLGFFLLRLGGEESECIETSLVSCVLPVHRTDACVAGLCQEEEKEGETVIGIGAARGSSSPSKYRNRRGWDAGANKSLEEGLAWLKRHQNPEGFWDSDGFCEECGDDRCLGQGESLNDVGITGLALLAYLGAGNTPVMGPYKNEVRKGISYLAEVQDRWSGCLVPKEGAHWMYNHAIGSLALIEAYGLTRMPILKRAAERALRFIHESRNPGKAWRYNNGEIDPADQNDVSVTAWMIQCLSAGRDFGLPCDDEALKDALRYIEDMTDTAKGRIGYKERGSYSAREAGDETIWPFDATEAMTAAGMFARILTGDALGVIDGQLTPLHVSAGLLGRKLPEWNEKRGTIDFYYWYYGTHAMFQMGGEYWMAWNDALRDALIANQKSEGCERGSWDPRKGPWGNNGGRIYTTALGVLCLEGGFRYKRLLPSAAPVAASKPEGDSIVRIELLPPIHGCDRETFDQMTRCFDLAFLVDDVPEQERLGFAEEFESGDWKSRIPVVINAFNGLDMLDAGDLAKASRIAAVWDDVAGRGFVSVPIKSDPDPDKMQANLLWNLTAVSSLHKIWHRKIDDGEEQRIFFGKCEKYRERQQERKAVRGIGGAPGNRTPAKYRKRTARKGNEGMQPAVERGLAWLARHQNPDGYWDSDDFCAHCRDGRCEGGGQALNDVGVTGLATLAFLGAGSTTHRGPYKDVVKRSIKYLVECQDPEDGCLVPKEGTHWMYNHAIGSLALIETYGLSRWLIIKKRSQKALDFIHKTRNPGKAWRYNNGEIDPNEQNDVSVTAWNVICLVAAADFGLRYHEEDLEDALQFIDDMTDPKTGRTGYKERGLFSSRVAGGEEKWPLDQTEAMTAAAMSCRIFASDALDGIDSQRPALDAGARLLTARLPEWNESEGCIDFYYWYYGSHAMFQMGGSGWKSWKDALEQAVAGHQQLEGCERGSWDPLAGPWGTSGGRVYATALCTLALQSAYRYDNVLQGK